jgi:hypothetical protein
MFKHQLLFRSLALILRCSNISFEYEEAALKLYAWQELGDSIHDEVLTSILNLGHQSTNGLCHDLLGSIQVMHFCAFVQWLLLLDPSPLHLHCSVHVHPTFFTCWQREQPHQVAGYIRSILLGSVADSLPFEHLGLALTSFCQSFLVKE